jgi:hypothetical protein
MLHDQTEAVKAERATDGESQGDRATDREKGTDLFKEGKLWEFKDEEAVGILDFRLDKGWFRMMRKESKLIFIMIAGLFLLGLACNAGGGSFTPPAVTIPAGAMATAQSAAGTAAVMAATGAAQGGAAVETAVAAGALETAEAMAGTVAAQGGAVVATVSAAGTPDISALREKLEALQPDENGNVSVTITDDEVNEAIQGGQANSGQSSLQNALVTFTGGTIVLAGDVTQPVTARLTVVFVPYVEDGFIRFEITQATLGTLNVPAALLQSAEATLNSTLGDTLNNLPGGVQVTAIEMGEGTMLVTGRREP